MRKVFQFCVSVASVAFLIGCSSKELTRSKANSLIDLKQDFATVSVLPNTGGVFAAMVRDKLWTEVLFGYKPTEETKKYFKAVGGGGLTLAQPIKRAVKNVNGISDGPLPNTKVVSFDWEYKEVPEFVLKHAQLQGKVHAAEALFKLYDDGWRVEQIEYH